MVVNPTESLTSNPFEDPWIRMVGCARFWLPGFGSGSKGKKSTKNWKKTFSLLKPKSELLKKREIIKISSLLNGSSSFRIKYAKKK